MKQMGRKLYHTIGGLSLLSVYYLLGRERALLVYAIVVIIVLSLDTLRLKVPAVNDFVFRKFGSFIRKNEAKKLTGTAPYVAGIGLSLFLYRTDIATAAVCFLAFGDVAATTVGERWGRTKISGQKSLEGTLAFFAAAVMAGWLLHVVGIPVPYAVVFTGALIAAAVELLPLPINDNLVIPLAAGGCMQLIAGLSGGR